MNLRLAHTELFVRDPQAAKVFYRDVLGFRVADEQAGGRIVWLELAGREVLLRPGTPPAGAARYEDCGQAMVLFTDDLTATRTALEARGLRFCGCDGGDACCPTFTDPDGNWFQLVNPANQSG
jgi:catechol 2,3-dioxygenase-like lactoylglutathione lyase family enzyme